MRGSSSSPAMIRRVTSTDGCGLSRTTLSLHRGGHRLLWARARCAKRPPPMLPRSARGTHSRYIARAKDKDYPFRLMGFGHRVYKNYDPRAKS